MVLQLLGLAGLAENWVEWTGFFANIVDHYTVFRDILFSWLPFEVPDELKDYLVVGTGVSTGIFRGKAISVKQELIKPEPSETFLLKVGAALVATIFWLPLVVIIAIFLGIAFILHAVRVRPFIKDEKLSYKLFFNMLIEFSKVVLVLVVLLFLFSDFKATVF